MPPLRRLARLSPLAMALAALSGPASAAPEPGPAPKDLDTVQVNATRAPYATDTTRTSTRTDTRLRDTPQSITVITQDLIRDQAMSGIADALRYVPGVGIAQGEGNRDTPIFRGNGSTADMFVDGVRDDVQYFRDLYNIDSVEVLKGPNAMIFGRGGSGGVLNRVSKVADWDTHRRLSLQGGDYSRRRATVDVGQPLNDAVALRVTGLYEDSEGFRDGFEMQRRGINPTLSLQPSAATAVTLGFEHFQDQRIADRGVPASPFVVEGRRLPVDTDPSTFFGNAALSPVDATVDAVTAVVDHQFGNGAQLRNRTRHADYDKFYQNVFPGAVDPTGTSVSISAYNNATRRTNLFNQTDLVFVAQTGALRHRLLVGAEFGRQETDNLRQTGYFGADANLASVQVPLARPTYDGPLAFRPSATDADNSGVARTAAVYVQDQVEFSPRWQAIVGLRYERFDVDFRNNRTGATFASADDLLSPRVGLVYKPFDAVSVYANYSVAQLPRAGEQLSSLSQTNQSLVPEKFVNLEVGAKWDVVDGLSVSAAAYRLERNNVLTVDPANPAVSVLVDGQRTQGLELGFTGNLTDRWRVIGGYAYQDGSTNEGATLAQLPRHSASLWNRFDFSRRWGVALGTVHRSEMFASTSNAVVLKGYTRHDAAIFLTVNRNLQLQLNVENILDKRYFSNAHSDNNLSPGSPRAFHVGANISF